MPGQKEGNQKIERTKGTPQGGVISPLLANLFLHHAFDEWMGKEFPRVPFERYADDIIVHCLTEKQAEYVLEKIKKRLAQCKLTLHPEKTKIVYCKRRTTHGGRNGHEFRFSGIYFLFPFCQREKRAILQWISSCGKRQSAGRNALYHKELETDVFNDSDDQRDSGKDKSGSTRMGKPTTGFIIGLK